LSRFPKKGSLHSEENAGGVEIGEHVVFFKAESHNHPSAVEPFQGAATGIGGIIRDVLALGARPIALLDSLKFGKINEGEKSDNSKHLLNGVVKGISAYGNSIGVPTVAGEVGFDACYETSPLVFVMAVGIVNKMISKIICPVDNYVVIVGSYTGRDGIHGASFASKELSENSKDDRPSVQVGDPFVKKILIEATLEILKLDEVLACQDCGAAGLLSSTSEMAYKGNCGMELYLDEVHLREEGMKPWEIMLSESQERMIFVTTKDGVNKVMEVAAKY
jgi:phosphoribosylformylglycinamidine synthase